MDERTLERIWHIRLTPQGVFVFTGVTVLLTIALFSCLVLFTPLRGFLPGVNDNIRDQLVEESVRTDSIAQVLDVQAKYLTTLKQVMAGEVSSDTVQSLDSLQMVARAELLEAKSQATADFMAQYEQKEKDNLLLFDIQTAPTLHFSTPALGVVSAPYNPAEGRMGVEISLPGRETVMAVLGGTIVSVELEINNTYTLVLLHDRYLSIYRNLGRVLYRVGDVVATGESIAISEDGYPLVYELWQNGHSVNPQDVMVL